MEPLPFNEQYLRHFVNHCLRDSEFISQVQDGFQEDTIPNDLYKRIVRLSFSFYAEHKAAPGTLVFQLIDDLKSKGLNEGIHKALSIAIDELFTLPLQNRKYLLDQFNSFARLQMAKSLMVPFMEDIKQNKWEDAEAKMLKLFQYKPNKATHLGTTYVEDPGERISRRLQQDTERCWTLIPEVDCRINGLKGGEIGVLMSQQSSIGKSAALVFLAKSFAFQGKKVIYFTLEESEADIEDRLDMCVAGLKTSQLTNAAEIRKSVRHMLGFKGGIEIVAFPAGATKISTLKKHTAMLANAKGFHADVVLIDYADLVGPETTALKSDMYASGEEVYTEWKGWMQEEELVGWTGMQSGRAAALAARTDMHFAGKSIAKTQIADLILGLNRTREEAEQGLTRIDVVKNRKGAARYEFTIKTDFEKMKFWVRSDDMIYG